MGFWSSLPFMAIQEAVHSGDFLATYLVHDNVTGHAWITKHMERCEYDKRPHHKSCRWAWNSARNPLQALRALPQDESIDATIAPAEPVGTNFFDTLKPLQKFNASCWNGILSSHSACYSPAAPPSDGQLMWTGPFSRTTRKLIWQLRGSHFQNQITPIPADEG